MKNARVSQIKEDESGRCWITLQWRGNVDVQKQFNEARAHCGGRDILFDYESDREYATLYGETVNAERNRIELACVRFYFIERFGWEEEEGETVGV